MQRADRLSELHVAAHELAASRSIPAVVGILAARIEALCGSCFWVALYEPETDTRDIRFCLLDGHRIPEWEVRTAVSAGLAGEVGRRAVTIATNDYVGECARRGVLPDAQAPSSSRAKMPWLGVPIIGGSQVLGILCVFHRHSHPITTGLIEVLETLAAHASSAIENIRRWAAELAERAALEAHAAVLQESETRYRSLVELSPDAIMVHARGTVVFVNAAAVQLLGATGPEQLVGTRVLDWIHADSREGVLRRVGELQQVGAEVPAAQERLVRVDGTPIEVEIGASAVIFQGQSAIQAVVRDITERKLAEAALRASEARFRRQYKGFPLPTYSWIRAGDDFVLEDYNDAAEAIVGVGIRNWLGVRASVRYADEPGVLADLETCSSEQRTVRRDVHDHFSDGGRPRDLAATYVFVPPATVMVHTEDVTEARQAEQQREAMVQFEKLRALGQMASGIAHDLNQSLMLVASYSDLARQTLIQDPPNLPEVEDLLTTTTQAALDGGSTVKRLLLFARAAPEHDIQLVDLTTLIRDAAQLTSPRWRDAPQAEARPITLHIETEGHPTIQGSPAQLRELMTNIIFNAVDALPTGGAITLRVMARTGRAVIEVADSGLGMSPEIQKRVFEPFFTTKGEAGTGMGLAMVFGIVEQHGGHIDVRSAPGEGTTFRISFPRVNPPSLDQGSPRAEPTRVEPLRPLRVLVVDDEPMMTRAVARMLKPAGHAVCTAGSGEEALEVLTAQPVDVVVSDMGMGAGMNGWELADVVKRRWPQIRFLLATGWGAAIDPDEARTRGVEAVLAKPYHPRDLLHALARN